MHEVEVDTVFSALTNKEYYFQPPLVFELREPEVMYEEIGDTQCPYDIWEVKLQGTGWIEYHTENLWIELKRSPLWQYIEDDEEILEENAKELRKFLRDRLQGTYKETERPKVVDE